MSYRRAGRFDQIKTYTGQCFRIAKNEKQWKFIVSTFLLMIIVAMVTEGGKEGMFQNFAPTQNGLFVVMCGCVWVGIFNSIQSICKERDIIKKEKQTGLHISSYVMAHVNYEFFLCLAEAIVVMIVLVVKNHKYLPDEGIIMFPLLEMFLSFFLVLFTSDMLALLISCIVKSPTVAMTVMPFVLIMQLVFADVVIALSDNMKKVADYTIVKWGMQSLQVIADTKDSVRDTAWDLTKDVLFDMEKNEAVFQLKDLKELHLLPKSGNLLEAWGMMLLFSAIYIILAILFLKQVSRDKR